MNIVTRRAMLADRRRQSPTPRQDLAVVVNSVAVGAVILCAACLLAPDAGPAR